MAEQISLHTLEMKENEEAVVLEPHSRLIMASRPHRRPSSEGHVAIVLPSECVGWAAAGLWMGDSDHAGGLQMLACLAGTLNGLALASLITASLHS